LSVNGDMKEFSIWLKDLSTKPLPGAVAAAALAAAMGAGLVAKAARVTLHRGAVNGATRPLLQEVIDLADRQQDALVRLAEADVRAYRAVLEARSRSAAPSVQREAWLQATEIPIRIAETCRSLVEHASLWLDECWPALCADLNIGLWLLETGRRAGLEAAQSNIGFSGEPTAAESLQLRVDALK
jgi:formiminotetrahydrofolate cyclodeaminase